MGRKFSLLLEIIQILAFHSLKIFGWSMWIREGEREEGEREGGERKGWEGEERGWDEGGLDVKGDEDESRGGEG